MASRRRAREFALQALYAWDQGQGAGAPGADPVTVDRMLRRLWSTQTDAEGLDGKPAAHDEIRFASRLAAGVQERQAEIDALIENASVNWRLARMPVVDRNILRLAGFELLACHDIPASVSINEAVELAKRFGDKDSRAFINGILDRIASDTGRGGRRHGRSQRRRRGGAAEEQAPATESAE